MICSWAEEANNFVAYPCTCLYLRSYIPQEYKQWGVLAVKYFPAQLMAAVPKLYMVRANDTESIW